MTQQQQTPKPKKLTKEDIELIRKELANKTDKIINGTIVTKDGKH